MRACAGSSSRRRAPCTAHRAPTTSSTRMPRCARSPRTRNPRCGPRRASPDSSTTTSSWCRCGTPPCTASRRDCGSTSSSTISPAGRRRPGASGCSPTACRGDRSSTSAISRASPSRSSRRRRSSCRGRPSMSARRSRTTSSATWPVSSPRSRAARSSSRATPRRTHGRTASTSRSSPAPSPISRGSGTRVAAPRSSSRPIDPYLSPPELFEGRRYVRLRQLRHLLDEGLLEEGLRWHAGARP